LGNAIRPEEINMKFFLASLAMTAAVGVWMVSVASSQLTLLDKVSTIETISDAYSNPINRSLKQDRLSTGTEKSVKSSARNADGFCDVGEFERACKSQIAGLKVSPPLVLTN